MYHYREYKKKFIDSKTWLLVCFQCISAVAFVKNEAELLDQVGDA